MELNSRRTFIAAISGVAVTSPAIWSTTVSFITEEKDANAFKGRVILFQGDSITMEIAAVPTTQIISWVMDMYLVLPVDGAHISLKTIDVYQSRNQRQ